ncbi:hypothetical protein [Pseudomonas sp. 13B_3.2_Bac1]|nr:hypothetical protein [Pseudomonas sp. 13B_3.2_Bac1]MCU1773256.1 hypothetical protein [Pseudomonas sp. 13B_3.2_Bac1]
MAKCDYDAAPSQGSCAMFPRYFRWIAAFGILAALAMMVITGLQVFSGMASAGDLIRPIIGVVAFGWMFTQSTKA